MTTPRDLLVASFAIRVVVLVYGEWHDKHFLVPYTDVDYNVYTDAARHVWEAPHNLSSPFDRHTFRYPPLLAYLMVPNLVLFHGFGKLLFVVSDVVAGGLIFRVCRDRGLAEWDALKLAAFWLLNPISINVSTRGNADTLACLLVVSMVHFLAHKRTLPAAAMYGLAVHFRMFPVAFAPTLLFFIDRDYSAPLSPLKEQAKFVVASAGLFLSLTGLFYHVYGFTFVFEAYLYHFVRTDIKHNFSPFFYSMYLHLGDAGFGILAFVPQMVLQAALSFRFHKDLVFAICIQTIAFVTFNKVCTAQYFLWYISMLPLALSSTTLRLWPVGVGLIAVWFATELHWLSWAFQLEFLGLNTFFQLWGASMLFFFANVAVLGSLLHAYQESKMFVGGKLQPVDGGKSVKSD